MFENEQAFKAEADRRGRKRAETRRRLLQAGMKTFAADGFERATVRDIAGAADLGLGTLYAHFKDKNDLLDALLDEAVAQLGARLKAAAQKEHGAVDQLTAAFRAFFDFALRHRSLFRILFGRESGSRSRRAARRGIFLEGVRYWLRAGIAQGVFGQWDEEFAAAVVVAMMARAVTLVMEAPADRAPLLVEEAIAFALAALTHHRHSERNEEPSSSLPDQGEG